MGFPVILQIIGYQNSGKTTVINTLLESLTKMGIRSGVIKHHGHEASLPFNDSGKDTERHRNAGAIVTTVSSAGNTILSMGSALSLEKTIELYKLLDTDCILIEGYKEIQYPRVILCRNKEDEFLIEHAVNPVAIISEENVREKYHLPSFLYQDQNKWMNFLVDHIEKGISKGKRGNYEIL
ncbi:molybdopterin-guanine dinucleotide biosynthesis protein B [Fictibacillus barbaricus]|uniref:Molybdopterin-guanine dinucleotide biosynthesis protein B n=1 Tax=Fictibacillus barbaricus TaxID=182136 RepID=A0ABU1TXS0_9BACL|nr:molybdopterin-guanine dinucleotide biosynthesis protein B [Fictibacillus barbaricus]MDR7071993.1 molybdopterin-guanine dinucleotide biosynthesis protein B [Fictibacillus barbaricus]